MTETTATTDTAAPAAAPASESTATNTAPTSTPDIFSGSSGGESVQTSPEASASPESGIINRLYTSEGGLSENYTDLLKEAGMENLTNTVAKYKSADGLLKGAANLVNFAGKKVEGVIVPNEGSSPEEIAEYKKAIGVPETPTAYDLRPENMPEGMDWDDQLAGDWGNVFHEAGVSQEQAQRLSQAYSDITNKQLEQANETLQANSNAEMAEQQAQIQKEWGANYANNVKAAVDMAEVVGFDLDNQADMAAVRNPKVLNLLLAKSQSMQEGTLPRGGDPASSMANNPKAQADKIYIKNHGKIHMAPPEEQKAYNELRRMANQQQRWYICIKLQPGYSSS